LVSPEKLDHRLIVEEGRYCVRENRVNCRIEWIGAKWDGLAQKYGKLCLKVVRIFSHLVICKIATKCYQKVWSTKIS
jgi:hypothetical protein